MTTTTVTVQDNDLFNQREDVADALLVGDKLRYATMDGTPHSVSGGRIHHGQSSTPLEVTIKKHATGEKKKFRDVNFFKELDNMVYVTGASYVDRVVGKVVRVTRVILP